MFDVCQDLVCVMILAAPSYATYTPAPSRDSRQVHERSLRTIIQKMKTPAANQPWDFGQAMAELSSGIVKGFVIFLGL